MTRKFEIVKLVSHHNRGQFIFARHIDVNHNFIVKEGSTLGGIPVFHYLEMSNTVNENSQLPLDVFVFRPMELSILPIDYFVEGQLVELVEVNKSS